MILKLDLFELNKLSQVFDHKQSDLFVLEVQSDSLELHYVQNITLQKIELGNRSITSSFSLFWLL